MFYGELFRLDFTIIKQTFLLSFLLIIFNFTSIIGTRSFNAEIVAILFTLYFAFIPLFEYIFNHNIPRINTILAIFIVLFGIFFILGFNIKNIFKIEIIILLFGNISFALYLVLTSKFVKNSNPTLITMFQLFFIAIFSFILWFIEDIFIKKIPLSLPNNSNFWGSVIFVSFFIRFLYSIIQTFACRYVSAFYVALIFSTELIMTIFFSPLIENYFFTKTDIFKNITIFKIVGAIIMIFGILIYDDGIYNKIKIKIEKHIKNFN